MRALLLTLTLGAIPAAARADLVLEPFGPAAAHPAAHLVPELAVDRDLPLLALGASRDSLLEGTTPGERQALAFVLGFFPGFGLGHAVAGSPQWPIWLAVDVVLLVFVGFGFWWGPWWHGAEGIGVLLWLVERGIEGYLAYRAAGGRPIAAREALPETLAVAPAAPVAARLQGLALVTF